MINKELGKIDDIISAHIETVKALDRMIVAAMAETMRLAIQSGKTIFFMGNGGSAADSQHLAAELVGRFKKERQGFSAVALTTDTSILTAVANDYGFEAVFERQVVALVRTGDVVVGLSTSGNSPNVVRGLAAASERGAVALGMTGRDGGNMTKVCDLCLKVPADITARIQEAHILAGHIICELVEEVAAGV